MREQITKILCGILIYMASSSLHSTNITDLVYQIPIKGAIGPATSQYVAKGIKMAHDKRAKLIILSIDTPGGLDIAMRNIIKSILGSDIPIVSYVYPSGSRAASAGTYILYASHLAAMSPGTNLGAATPISIMPVTDTNENDGKKKNKPGNNILMKKVKNDSKAYIRSLAELRNRNVAWAEKAVTEADSISAQLAFKRKVIDFIAKDQRALVIQANGRIVDLKGNKYKIDVKNPIFEMFVVDFKTKFLLTITDPSIAYMLFLAGIYGLFFEFTNPGLIVPGVLGGIAMIVSLYAMNSLPISYAGLALLLLGVMLIVAEVYVTSYGILGVGGIIALILGSIFLYDESADAFHLGYPLISGVIGINLVILVGIIYFAIQSHRKKIFVGLDSMLKTAGIALTDVNNGRCSIIINGEIWNAQSVDEIYKGQQVEVTDRDGLLLTIKIKKE